MGIDVEAWYRRHGPMVLRRCRVLLRDEQAAVEAMQDVFVELVRREHRIVDTAPSSLLYRMATNTCLNRIRSKKRRPEEPDSDLVERIARAPNVEERTLAGVILDQVFGRVPESTRTMAVLHLRDGLTLQEVADVCGMSVSGVRKRLRLLKAHVAELEEM